MDASTDPRVEAATRGFAEHSPADGSPERRIRILHSDTDDIENPLRGGQPVRTYAINSRLAKAHDITVFTSVYRGCRRRVVRKGISYSRLGFRVPPLGLSPHLTFLMMLGPVVARTPHDLVVEEFTPPVGFCGLPWWTKAPVILMVQWNFFEQWEQRYKLPFSRWMRRLARSGRYRHVIVQTQEMGREFQALLPNAQIRHIPCGIDSEAFNRNEGPGEYVLFLGRLDFHHKGLDLLLDAWRRVCGPASIPLVIAGDGPERPKLERIVEAEKLGGLVRLIGRVEGPEKTAAFAKSRIVVMPSRYETFGISALEAMAASKPLVCFDIKHLNELAEAPWAELVAPYDAEALGRAVVRLWANPAECEAMGARAWTRAQDFHWDVIARQQEAFYMEVLASGK